MLCWKPCSDSNSGSRLVEYQRRTARVIALTVLVLAVAGAGSAAPIYFSQVSAEALAGDVDRQDTGELLGVDTVSISAAATDTTSSRSANAWASVEDGALHAYATANGTSTGSTIFDGAGSLAIARFFDTFKLVSSTLAEGTPVSLLFDQRLSYSLNGSGCEQIALVYAYTVVSQNGAVRQQQDGSCDSSDFATGNGIANGVIGEELTVLVHLMVAASASGSGIVSTSDASHTLNLFVQPLGDFTFITASGNTYQVAVEPDPVPEPTSLLLLGTGISVAALRRRRRESTLR